MKILYLSILKFRGLREFAWTATQPMNCLIGPGDSGKSTILDAIEYVLSPRWNLTFTDVDFYNGDSANTIEIEATVGNLPDELKKDDKFGLQLRGWNDKNEIVDEPEEGTEPVLTIRLEVTSSLEPDWRVINDRLPEGIPISARDRGRLGVVRLGPYVDRHLGWGRNSALSKLTANDDEVALVLADAGRSAREAVANADLEGLQESAVGAAEAAEQFGVHPKEEYHAALDANLSISGQSAITLHDGEVPVRMAGMGTTRLLALAIQHRSVPEGGILLIDEIEMGLEPHRLRQLLRILRPTADAPHQVFMTSHSSVTISELTAVELNIVRIEDGVGNILTASEEIQALLRKAPDAFLGRKILVCEGETEVGVTRHLDKHWQTTEYRPPFAALGVIPITSAKGGGDDTPKMAAEFRRLGYSVGLLCDSDKALTPSAEELQDAGIVLAQWSDELAIEERVCLDIPYKALRDLLDIAIERAAKNGKDTQTVYDAIGSQIGLDAGRFNGDMDELLVFIEDEDPIRRAFGNRAKHKNHAWFKRIDYGERLGEVICSYLDDIAGTDLADKIGIIKGFVYDE
ncbi:MAG: AAA family ATPase [Chloroflexi bacterium]|nr:AAA family ATPase [Chloroflexota bacterium]